MKVPDPPPPLAALLEGFDGSLISRGLTDGQFSPVDNRGRYLHWDDLQRRPPPPGYSHLEVWKLTAWARRAASRELPLRSTSGQLARFFLTDHIDQMLMDIDRRCGGNIATSASASATFSSGDRDRVLVSSLQEESITSSQLEGANTTRKAARQMLRENRKPVTHGERMIANNFAAMERIRVRPELPLSVDELCEIHALIASGTLEDSADEGRPQRPGDARVSVYWQTNGVDTKIHEPPPAAELPERLSALCTFANDVGSQTPFVHPVLRALTVHFWIGYDHPFVDGNGRLARTLFYRSMLGSGYWLAEYLSVSSILRKRPSKYVRSYLLCETDDLDLTYFFVDQLEVIVRALDALDAYLERKRAELAAVTLLLRGRPDLNHRQLALLGHALRHPGEHYGIRAHQSSNNIAYESARQDLVGLAEMGLLERFKKGREFVFRSPLDLADRLKGI
jgi:Fic family protein